MYPIKREHRVRRNCQFLQYDVNSLLLTLVGNGAHTTAAPLPGQNAIKGRGDVLPRPSDLLC